MQKYAMPHFAYRLIKLIFKCVSYIHTFFKQINRNMQMHTIPGTSNQIIVLK